MSFRLHYRALKNIIGHYHNHLEEDHFFDLALGEVLETGSFSKRGAIFITSQNPKEKNKTALELRSSSFLPEELKLACKIIFPGQCLCGKAFEQKRTIVKTCLDSDHEMVTANMENHGHICTPIINQDNALGVINTYIEAHKVPSDEDIAFLEQAAHLIGSFVALQRKSKELAGAKRERNQLFYYLNETNLVTETNARGIITYANEAFCKTAQYSKDEIIGKPHSLVNSGFHEKKFWSDFWQSLKEKGSWRGEICNRAKDGTIYWVHTNILAKIEGKEVTGFLSIRQDITEAKRKEEKQKKEKERQQRIQKLNSLGVLAAGMGHEINNPLTIAHGYLKKIKAKIYSPTLSSSQITIDSEFKESLKYIEEAHLRIRSIVKGIKAFSRIGGGELEVVNIKQTIDEVSSQYLEIKETPFLVKFFVDIEEDSQAIVHKQSLRQVLLNLLNNSIEAFEESQLEGTLKISMWIKKEKDFLHIYFSDNGPGLEGKTSEEEIFDLFFTTKDPGKGTGLGLALSRELCHQMGGELQAVNLDAGGLTMKLSLKNQEDI